MRGREKAREEEDGVLAGAGEGGHVGAVDEFVAEKRQFVPVLGPKQLGGADEGEGLVDDNFGHVVVGVVSEVVGDDPIIGGAQCSSTRGMSENEVLIQDMMHDSARFEI